MAHVTHHETKLVHTAMPIWVSSSMSPGAMPIIATTAAPVSSGTGGLASEQITKFELTAFHTPAFESASTVFEPCLVRSESTNVTDLDRQQAVDTVMVKLLHETNWLP